MIRNIMTAAVALTIAYATAMADDPAADIAYCRELADAQASASATAATTSAAITGAAGALAAIISGRDPTPAVGSAVRSAGNSAASERRMAEYRKRSIIDRCMRERWKE